MIVTPSTRADAPIGVFDSGLGGLTVARRLRREMPLERIIYLADQAHVPYGGRDLEQVRGFACAISEALFEAGCKAVVMACNISTATALGAVQSRWPQAPVTGVILPGARAALRTTRNGRIGVLATVGTVKSGAYPAALLAESPQVEVTAVGCPAFVPLVESGQTETPAAREAAREYLAPLLAAGVDTVILGCTHYPFLLTPLRAEAPHVRFVDPADETVQELRRLLQERQLESLNRPEGERNLLLTTGDAAEFERQLSLFLPAATCDLGAVVWNDNQLNLRIPENALT